MHSILGWISNNILYGETGDAAEGFIRRHPQNSRQIYKAVWDEGEGIWHRIIHMQHIQVTR